MKDRTWPVPELADARRKRLRFRAWHRGTKEMDLVLGPWADARLAGMDETALDAFEALLEESDPDLWNQVTGVDPLPDGPDGALRADLIAFHEGRRST